MENNYYQEKENFIQSFAPVLLSYLFLVVGDANPKDQKILSGMLAPFREIVSNLKKLESASAKDSENARDFVDVYDGKGGFVKFRVENETQKELLKSLSKLYMRAEND